MNSSTIERPFATKDRTGAPTLISSLRERNATLGEDISLLKGSYQPHPPVSLLPPEILCRIFSMHRREYNFETRKRRRSGSVGWIRITHVCRLWREVAIAYSPLWSDLSFLHPPFTEVMLKRSGSAPLHIEYTVMRALPQHTLDDALVKVFYDALSQAERLQTVKVAADEDSPIDYLSVLEHLTTRAPNLKALTLSTAAILPPSRLNGDLLGGWAPALQSLDLDPATRAIWKALPLGSTSLGILSLSLLECVNNDRPSIKDFLGALSRMPNLKVLCLYSMLPSPSQSHSPLSRSRGHAVTLPTLKTLTLRDRMQSILETLQLVKFSKAAKILLSIRDAGMEDTKKVMQLLEAVEASCDAIVRGDLVDLQIHQSNEPEFNLSFGSGCRLELEFDEPNISLQEFIAALHTQFNLSTLTRLHILHTTEMDCDAWTETLSRLPRLETITFKVSQIGGFIDALEIQPTGPEHEPFHHFAALSRIEFDRVHFNWDGDPEGLTAKDAIDGLIQGLSWRERCKPLRVLEITQCARFSEGDCKLIQEAIPSLKVVWDGFTSAKDCLDLYNL